SLQATSMESPRARMVYAEEGTRLPCGSVMDHSKSEMPLKPFTPYFSVVPTQAMGRSCPSARGVIPVRVSSAASASMGVSLFKVDVGVDKAGKTKNRV
ncbi:MAG TPA: hypothetical protein PKL74_11095, partial [Tenuifilaceae bacterium]|nr:hypothetical protein [Tenuifilaceae bacterium]